MACRPAHEEFMCVCYETKVLYRNKLLLDLRRTSQRLEDIATRVNKMRKKEASFGRRLLLGPLVFATDLVLLLGGKIARDIERLTNLLGSHVLDRVGDRLAASIEKGFDFKVICGLAMSRSVSIRGKIESERLCACVPG